MNQQSLDFTITAPEPTLMPPSAIQARRSGHQRVRAQVTESMGIYREALIRFGPCTDQELSERAGLPLSSINGRRNDWLDYQPERIVAVRSVLHHWKTGKRTKRTIWMWKS